MIKKLALLGCICVLISCHKNHPGQPEFYGTASATLNGKSWTADKVRCGALSASCFNSRLSIGLEKYNSAGFLSELFYFSKFVPDVSVEQVPYPENSANRCSDTLNASYSVITDDGDVIEAFYDVDRNSKNYFRVESYDPQTGKIAGSFGGTYIIDSRSVYNALLPDTIQVVNGRFDTKILF